MMLYIIPFSSDNAIFRSPFLSVGKAFMPQPAFFFTDRRIYNTLNGTEDEKRMCFKNLMEGVIP
jgi:hypothetical protein